VRGLLALLAFAYLLILAWHLSQVLLGQQPEGSLGLLWELTLYFFLPVPFLVLAALMFRARMALFLALLPVALFVLLYGQRFLPRTPPAAAEPTFRVMTFNAGAGGSGVETQAVLAAVEEARPDVVATQEVQGQALQTLRRALAESYPYQAATSDVATFSTYPLIDAAEFRLKDSGYRSQEMDIQIENRLVRLTNVHLQRTGPRLGGRRSIVAFVRNYEPGLLEGQVSELLERHLLPVNGPQLLTGQEVALPLVRIDYIFHSPDLMASNARVVPDGGSDHIPVVADLAFRQ
jgi:vancomycin resistance protein VanJ